MDAASAKIQSPYFSRTMNLQQIDVSPGGGSNNQLPPKKALTNQRAPNPPNMGTHYENLAIDLTQKGLPSDQSPLMNGQAKTPLERKRREGSQSWQRPPQPQTFQSPATGSQGMIPQ